MSPDLYPSIVALVSLAANIAANHPKSDSIRQAVRTHYAATALADAGCCTAETAAAPPDPLRRAGLQR